MLRNINLLSTFESAINIDLTKPKHKRKPANYVCIRRFPQSVSPLHYFLHIRHIWHLLTHTHTHATFYVQDNCLSM